MVWNRGKATTHSLMHIHVGQWPAHEYLWGSITSQLYVTFHAHVNDILADNILWSVLQNCQVPPGDWWTVATPLPPNYYWQVLLCMHLVYYFILSVSLEIEVADAWICTVSAMNIQFGIAKMYSNRNFELNARSMLLWNLCCMCVTVLMLNGVMCQYNNYHYTKLTFVCESRRSRKAIRPKLNTFLFLHRWTWTLHVAAHWHS